MKINRYSWPTSTTQFICLLRSALQADDYRTVRTTANTDTDIVSVAQEERSSHPTTVAAVLASPVR